MRSFSQYSKRHQNRKKDNQAVSLYVSWIYGKTLGGHGAYDPSVRRFLASEAAKARGGKK